MSTFFGFEISKRGMYSSQTALNVINNNIGNSNTLGYSRQVCRQKATSPIPTYNGKGMVGSGTEISEVIRVRDEYLDKRYWDQSTYQGEWEVKETTFSELEYILGDTTGNGLNEQYQVFFDSIQDVANEPDSTQSRAVLKENGNSLCKGFNDTAQKLEDLQKDTDNSIRVKVEELNSYAEQISALNERIYKYELDGSTANDLRDQRTLLVDELSRIADIEADEICVGTMPNGKKDMKFVVNLNGVQLVNHFDCNTLECYEINNGSAANGISGIRWEKSGNPCTFHGGEIKGYLDMRDGTGEDGEFKGIPYYMEQLDNLARTFAKAFNEGVFADGKQYYSGHAGGCGLDGSTGVRFFTCDSMSSEEFMNSGMDIDSRYENISAANISISSDVGDSTEKIAAASVGGEAGNGRNMEELFDLCQDKRMSKMGNPQEFLNQMIGNMSISSRYARNTADNQRYYVKSIDNRRNSISGVSVDEESANMIRYQQAYDAAAKMISVMDEILDVTINQMGVG